MGLFGALCFITIFISSIAADTLSAGQSLVDDGEVLLSPSQVFELGFFSPGSSTSRFLGIWYKATPDVVVWVANRQNPISGLTGVLTLSETGNLLLTSTQAEPPIIWSSNSSLSTPVLRLLDTGNLVVVDNENATYFWQSFDFPGDTRLPGMKMVNDPNTGLDKHLTSWKSPDDPSPGEFVFKIENHGLSQLSVLTGRRKTYRSGPWDGAQFTGLPPVTYRDIESERQFSGQGELIAISEAYSSSSIMRVTLSASGLIQRHMMNEERDGWILAFSDPYDVCTKYGWCGPNGVCKADEQPVCECLRGFVPRYQKQWDAMAWSGGCARVPPLDCHKGDGFMQFKRYKFPDTLSFEMNASMSSGECLHECLRNCNCTAYAAPYLVSESAGCLMWFGDLIDVEDFTGDLRAGPSIYIRVPISELENRRKKRVTIILASAACNLGMLGLGLSLGVIIFRMRRKRQAYMKKKEEFELPLFGLPTIAAATNNFSHENMIGKGGFGPVYKGNLSAEKVIAVKRMSANSGQGDQEFKTEVTLIAKLQHRNLVRIMGCCIEREEKILIYEYMHNKSLDYFIFDQSRSSLLDWPKRFDIIMGVARGLLYLHHDSRLKIIHRDLKTSNILLDENLNAKISDFGLARLFEGDQTMASTKRVVGTYGYMAPEYAFDGKFCVKTDVFSMGVVILEIVSGRKNRGFKNLQEEAWLLWKEGRELEVMDPCYSSSYVEWQVKRCIHVGLLCVQKEACKRPMMPSVLLMLSTEDTVLAEPKKPGFFLHSSSDSTSHMYASTNSLTNTDLQGR
ncbi:G-type lectin S-receptor-like serine/threonine-protein kinase At4g27290 [Salvia miltiorrhiza]|uniref:G-type lectin S-receptor-like serine/threonine-protein kinase At4g27290 n=1 Tax=Salvia miltiorrhiza TaxID=226208 RepID=UPI0025ACE3FD|nr:G-type lectin S-receptor-like serine/threonine-protein kinase At4g27290 [Salvia miltiorrhiza]